MTKKLQNSLEKNALSILVGLCIRAFFKKSNDYVKIVI